MCDTNKHQFLVIIDVNDFISLSLQLDTNRTQLDPHLFYDILIFKIVGCWPFTTQIWEIMPEALGHGFVKGPK